MLKILQVRLQQYVNHELTELQAGLEKAEEPEIKSPTSAGSLKKQGSSRKTSISALLTMPKPPASSNHKSDVSFYEVAYLLACLSLKYK